MIVGGFQAHKIAQKKAAADLLRKLAWLPWQSPLMMDAMKDVVDFVEHYQRFRNHAEVAAIGAP